MGTVIKTVSMPKDVWAEIDKAAKRESRSRSDFLRQSAVNTIARRQRPMAKLRPKSSVSKKKMLNGLSLKFEQADETGKGWPTPNSY